MSCFGSGDENTGAQGITALATVWNTSILSRWVVQSSIAFFISSRLSHRAGISSLISSVARSSLPTSFIRASYW